MTSSKDTRVESIGTAEWPKHLRTPDELRQSLKIRNYLRIIRSPVRSKLVLQFIGGLSYVLAHLLNKTQIHNRGVFKDELDRIEELNRLKKSPYGHNACSNRDKITRGPFLTLSNHISCLDDPVLWGALLSFSYYFRKTDTVRWSAAAVDICFSKTWHTTFFALGKTFPIVRGIGLEQPAMIYASALLSHDEWLHLFPEGRVMRDHNQQVISNRDRGYIFKWGIAKLILDYLRPASSENSFTMTNSEMRILPFYHIGMDKILPIGRPYIPKAGHKMTIYVKPSVIRMQSQLLDTILSSRSLSLEVSKSKSEDEIKRIKLTNFLEDEMERLIEPATKAHTMQ